MSPVPRTVILVHGAFHGAWCWAGLQAELDRRGIPSLAVDLPGHGASTDALEDLHGDAAAVARLLDRTPDEVVLVGHSYGGSVISQAGEAGRVAHLVYLTALVLDVGESSTELMATLPPGEKALAKLFVRGDDRLMRADPELAVPAFYGSCEPAAAAAAVARLSPQRAATLRQPATHAAWRSRPSTYVRCLADRAIPPAAQDVLAARCNAVVDLQADHSPFLGVPSALADVLEPLARR